MPERSARRSQAPPSRRAVFLSCATLTLVAALAYHNSFTGPFVFDDPTAIVNNPSIRHFATALHSPTGGGTVTGRPLLNLSFAVNYAVSGTRVWSYHALNLAIHLLAGLTLFGIVRRTLQNAACARRSPLGESGPDSVDAEDVSPTLTAFAIALIWTVHPLQTESVTYIAQRAESLMGLFYLLTLYCFIRWGEGRSVWAVLSVLACFLGMGTKEVMVSAPIMVLLYDRSFVSGSFRESWRRHARFYAGLAATWIPLGCLVTAANGRNGTAGFHLGVSWWRYVLTQFPAIVRYLKLSLWPHPLVFDYGAQWVQRPWTVLPSAIAVGVLAIGTGAALLRSPSKGTNSGGQALGFAGAWFFAILAPTSLVPGLRQTMAEHRMYLALVPVVAVAVLAASRWGPRGRWACLGLGLALAGLTISRNEDYRSDLVLWGDTVGKAPDNPFARNNFGLALSDNSQLQKALAQYREALRLDPNLPEVHNNLGVALIDTQRFPEAIAEFEQALRLKPAYAEAHNDLGIALVATQRLSEGIAQFEQALDLRPGYAEAYNGLGTALTRQGRKSEAILNFDEALRLKPDDAEAEDGLGILSAGAGRLPEAVSHYERALRLDPDYADAHNNLGDTLAQLGRLDEARVQFEAALRRTPDDPKLRANLGKILARMGRFPEAVAQYEQALQLDPGNAATHFGYGNMLAQTGGTQAAIEQYVEALRCRPDYSEAHNNLGNALARLGRLPDALSHFREAVRLERENAGFHANFGNALAQLGRTTEAIGQYEEALRINPELSQVRTNLLRLQAKPPTAP